MKNGSITPVHRVMPHQSNLQPHIIPPESPKPIITEEQQHVSSPRVPIIPYPIPVLPPRVPMSRHQYNLQHRKKVAYSCLETVKLYLDANIVRAMEYDAFVQPETGAYKEFRHLITVEDKSIWKRSLANKLGDLNQGIRDIKVTKTVFLISNNNAPFITKKVTYGKIVCDIKSDKVKNIALDRQ